MNLQVNWDLSFITDPGDIIYWHEFTIKCFYFFISDRVKSSPSWMTDIYTHRHRFLIISINTICSCQLLKIILPADPAVNQALLFIDRSYPRIYDLNIHVKYRNKITATNNMCQLDRSVSWTDCFREQERHRR